MEEIRTLYFAKMTDTLCGHLKKGTVNFKHYFYTFVFVLFFWTEEAETCFNNQDQQRRQQKTYKEFRCILFNLKHLTSYTERQSLFER